MARSTGLDVTRAWSGGGYTFAFVTSSHQHGWWDKKTGDWGWDGDRPTHFTSCHELFPQDFTAKSNESLRAVGVIP